LASGRGGVYSDRGKAYEANKKLQKEGLGAERGRYITTNVHGKKKTTTVNGGVAAKKGQGKYDPNGRGGVIKKTAGSPVERGGSLLSSPPDLKDRELIGGP